MAAIPKPRGIWLGHKFFLQKNFIPRAKNKNQRGFVLIAAVLVVSLLILLAVYVTNFAITDLKIANSQVTALQTYYLAESGVAEAIWRLRNDATWKDNFETNPSWSYTYTRNSALYSNGAYQIQVQNTGLARGEITVTGFLNIGGRTAQRRVKTVVYKALGDSPIGDNGEFADGNIDISWWSTINIYNGGIHANGNVIVNAWSTLNVDGDVKATGNINKLWNSTINATSQQSGAAPIAMPAISFDTAGDPESYRARAAVIYSQSDFEDLLWDNQNLTLPGPITYVDGKINIKGNQTLTINGVLAASDDIMVGKNTSSCCWGLRCGRSEVIINKISGSAPSGLLAKGKINFELCLDSLNAEGLIYANDQINMLSLPSAFEVEGAVVSRKLTLTSIWQGANITQDKKAVMNTIGDPIFSPVVTVEHWEEEY